MKIRTTDLIAVALIAFVVARNWDGGSVLPDILTPTKPDAVTYVVPDRGSAPTVVSAAFDKLNRGGIVATVFEYGTTDGTGETPEQYKLAEAEAKRVGMPALVVTGEGKLIRAITGEPTTVEQVLEAAK